MEHSCDSGPDDTTSKMTYKEAAWVGGPGLFVSLCLSRFVSLFTSRFGTLGPSASECRLDGDFVSESGGVSLHRKGSWYPPLRKNRERTGHPRCWSCRQSQKPGPPANETDRPAAVQKALLCHIFHFRVRLHPILRRVRCSRGILGHKRRKYTIGPPAKHGAH
jgi:hypothetical protein